MLTQERSRDRSLDGLDVAKRSLDGGRPGTLNEAVLFGRDSANDTDDDASSDSSVEILSSPPQKRPLIEAQPRSPQRPVFEVLPQMGSPQMRASVEILPSPSPLMLSMAPGNRGARNGTQIGGDIISRDRACRPRDGPITTVARPPPPISSADPDAPSWGHGGKRVVLLNAGTTEFDACVAVFQATLPEPFTVESIVRVENSGLYRRYSNVRRLIAQENGGDANVARMFHGTRCMSATSIALDDDGVDMRFSVGGMFGKASYFSYDTSYVTGAFASQRPGGDAGVVEFLVCAVARGHIEQRDADASIRRPSPGYHSVEGGVSAHVRAIMCYQLYQSYPLYVVSLRLTNRDAAAAMALAASIAASVRVMINALSAPVAPLRVPGKALRAPKKAPLRAPKKAPLRVPGNALRAPKKAPLRAPKNAPLRAPKKAPLRGPVDMARHI